MQRSTTHRDENGVLCLNNTPLDGLSKVEGVGTPTYVYDLDAMAAERRPAARSRSGRVALGRG